MKETISRILEEFLPEIERKEISLVTKLSSNKIFTNKPLFEILISNLLSNSIKHNHVKGTLEVTINETGLCIKNTGKQLENNAEEMFARFKKNSDLTSSIGLGLSIVKKICQFLDYSVKYSNKNNIHEITINLE